MPWQNHPKRESTGTGFVIRDRLILTNAHVVADQTYVTVKRHGSGTKYRAGAVDCYSYRKPVYHTVSSCAVPGHMCSAVAELVR